jgi:hypothetical protein
VRVLVTTYERPGALQRLLEDLVETRAAHDVSVVVYDDASKADYARCHALVEREGWSWVRASQNHGKRRFWAWINRIFADQRDRTESVFLMLQDDVRLCDRFFDRALNLWNTVTDKSGATLNLMRDARTQTGIWTGHPGLDCGPVFLSGWVDGIYLAHRRCLSTLDYRVDAVAPVRWQKDPRKSSGVGQQLSGRLSKAGMRMYAVKHSLLVHASGDSKLNPVERRENPLTTTHFIDGDAAARELASGKAR